MAEVEKPKQSEVKPRRRRLRFVLLSLVLAVLVLVAAPFVYLSQAGGLSGSSATNSAAASAVLRWLWVTWASR